MKYYSYVFRVEEYDKNIFMLSVIHNPCKNAKWLSIFLKKYTFSLSQWLALLCLAVRGGSPVHLDVRCHG